MLDLVDLLLLGRGIPADDRKLGFRRVDGNPTSKVIYFLPWQTSFGVARHVGFTPLDFLACYEMPPGHRQFRAEPLCPSNARPGGGC